MIANAMFYKAEDGKTKSGVITIVGPIKFSMGQVNTRKKQYALFFVFYSSYFKVIYI